MWTKMEKSSKQEQLQDVAIVSNSLRGQLVILCYGITPLTTNGLFFPFYPSQLILLPLSVCPHITSYFIWPIVAVPVYFSLYYRFSPFLLLTGEFFPTLSVEILKKMGHILIQFVFLWQAIWHRLIAKLYALWYDQCLIIMQITMENRVT